jgi:N-acetylglucosamine kinase-like BadF-type ATPase
MAAFFLGVDGGQSSTIALIGDESGRVLGSGRSGPCNHVAAAEGPSKFVRVIRDCLRDACRQAGLDAGTIHFNTVCLGFSGGPVDKEPLLGGILAADRLIVTDDALVALSGATAGDPGVVTISGTGSIAFGRNASGERARAGGWGYIFGDEGSSFDITRRALRAALCFEEGWGPATSLHRALLDAARAGNANELLHRFYTPEFPRHVIAGFSRLVDDAARSGDGEAIRILEEAARELCVLANAVSRNLFGGQPARVTYIGGAFRSDLLRQHFRALIENEGDHVQPPRYGPAAGALIEAYRCAGLKVELSNVPEEKT